MGKVSFGQGSTASDGTIEEDLSGTGVISGAGFAATGESLAFVVSGQDERTESGETVGDLFDNMDGLSRKDRLRYDSPSFGGFQVSSSFLSESWGDNGTESAPWDVAFRYGREFGGFEVAAAVSRWKKNSDTTGQGGSASVLAPSGTSIAVSLSSTETDGEDHEPTFSYVKLGQELDVVSAGKTAVSVSYASTDDQGAKGNSGSYYDLAVVQKVKDLGTELYALYGVYDANIAGMQVDDITVAGAGARIKF